MAAEAVLNAQAASLYAGRADQTGKERSQVHLRKVILLALGVIVAVAAIAAALIIAGHRFYTLRTEAVGLTPASVVTRFYEGHLDSFGDRASGEMRNPLVDGTYRTSSYLTPEFIEWVDQTVASAGPGAADPFLCAQDVPEGFTVGEPVIQGDEASAVVSTTFPGHSFTVRLIRSSSGWKISDVECSAPASPSPASEPNLAPQEVVQSFYDRYLEATGDATTGPVRSWLVDGAYRTSSHLAPEFVQEVDEIVASFDRGGYDPFLLAQDIPARLDVDPAEVLGDEATVVVRFSWDDGSPAFDRRVALEQIDGAWKITGVSLLDAEPGEKAVPPAPAEGYQTLAQEEYGFTLRYPADWTPQGARIDDPTGDMPIDLVLVFSPREWAGPMPPASIEVGTGGLEQLRGMWALPPEGRGTSRTINGRTALVAQAPYGEMFYVFEHPFMADAWVTFRDNMGAIGDNSDPATSRLEQAVNSMLSSLEFMAPTT
jgi:hypothetical protein